MRKVKRICDVCHEPFGNFLEWSRSNSHARRRDVCRLCSPGVEPRTAARLYRVGVRLTPEDRERIRRARHAHAKRRAMLEERIERLDRKLLDAA